MLTEKDKQKVIDKRLSDVDKLIEGPSIRAYYSAISYIAKEALNSKIKQWQA